MKIEIELSDADNGLTVVKFEGKEIARSKTPLRDACRVLLAHGANRRAMLVATWNGRPFCRQPLATLA